MKKYLFATSISLVAVLILSALFTGSTYFSLENYGSDNVAADNFESSEVTDYAGVEELAAPLADAKTISKSDGKEENLLFFDGVGNFPYYRETGTGEDQEESTSDPLFQIMGLGGQSGSGLVKAAGDGPSVNVTIRCYDINGDPLYLANVFILDHDWGYQIYSGFTNSSGVFEAVNLQAGIVDVYVSWGNASAPGQPGYYMCLRGIDATSSVEVVVNALDLRAGGGLAEVTLTLQNSTGYPMLDTRLFMALESMDGAGFPLGMGPITDSAGIVRLYLSNDTWVPDPTYYDFLVCQMTPSNNTLFILTDWLVPHDGDATITVPSLSELATVNLAFSSPSDISLMRDIRLFFEFPGFVPPEVDRDDLALMYLPSKLHGKMLFLVPLGPGGALFLPVADDSTTALHINATVPFQVAAIYTNTTEVSGGPWLYIPMKMFDPLSPGHVEDVSMGGSYLKLRSVTPLEAYLGSAPKLFANFTDEFYNPLILIVGNGSTSFPTGFPGVFSHLTFYNLTIWYPEGDVWYSGLAAAYEGGVYGILFGVDPPFPGGGLDRPGTYDYAIFIDTGPWPLDPPGTQINPYTGTFEATVPPAEATFGMDKDLHVWTEEDTLLSGSYLVDKIDFGIWIHNEDDYTNTTLGDLGFYVEASDIIGVGWEEHAEWDSTHANWTFPPDFVIPENEGFGTGFSIDRSESCNLRPTLTRVLNETIFTADGYQMANFTVNFADTDFLWSWGRINANERWEVNASFVPGTFETDAPLEGFKEDLHGIHFEFRKDLIEAGVDYHFSVVVKVELTGHVPPPILYKPEFGIGQGLYYDKTVGMEGYVAEMPPGMLPDHVSVAQASTNTSNVWTLERHDHVIGVLNEVLKPVGARATFGMDKNLNVGTEEDTLPSGSYVTDQINFGIWIHNEDDDTDTTLGDLGFYVEASDIIGVGWEEHAEWDSTHANWTFPPDFVIPEDKGFGTGFSIDRSESCNLKPTLTRVLNETIFTADGYQMANFTVNFADTDFLWSWGHIGAHERWEVNASFVPGTFLTDAPLEWFEEKEMHWIHFEFRKDLIEAGVDYHFSVVVKVELTGHVPPPILYKPHFSIGHGLYHETAAGGEGYTAEMPPGMLPDHVSVAQASTNTSNVWTLRRHDQVEGFLQESVVEMIDLSDLPEPFTADTRIIIPISDPHGPCGAAHTMDTMGGILIANRLGLEGGVVSTAMDSYSYISTYDYATAKVTMTDTTSHLIVIASPGVNQVTYYYNELTDAGGTRVLPVLFLRDAQGDYLYVQSTENVYRIEYDGTTVTADYAVIEIYQDDGRYVLLVYGLGGEGSKAAAKVVSEFDVWGLTGQATIVKYYDSDADGYLDTITIVETVP